MATLADGGRITTDIVDSEIKRLHNNWQSLSTNVSDESLTSLSTTLDSSVLSNIDLFEQSQLVEVIKICKTSSTMAEAGRLLFNKSRLQKSSQNDTNRLKVYLQKFNLTFSDIKNTL
jgi:transcriptional regulatory protein RtcR